METQKIIENNKLIAEFMGAEIIDKRTSILPVAKFKEAPGGNKKYSGFELSYLEYHKSWDWLMSVVEKIAKIPNSNHEGLYQYEVHFSLNFITGVEVEGMYNKNFGSKEGYLKKQFYKEDLLTNTYNAVLDFIKWYNQNKQ